MSRKVILKSSDGLQIEVEQDSLRFSGVLREMESDQFSVSNVDGVILKKLMEWCEYHQNVLPSPSFEGISSWDFEFLNVDSGTLFELINAANYLAIEDVLRFCCQKVGSTLYDKSPEEIRQILNITSDFTPEEEEQIRLENAWCD